MSEHDNYLDTLKWRLSTLKEEIIEHQQEIQNIFNQVEVKQDQIKSITQLLAAEGMLLEDPDLAKIIDAPIADLAYDFLKNDPDKKPYHYTAIAKNLIAQGILIPGKNPEANLLTHISRDHRFVRTASGTYGLMEHGHQSAPKTKRRKRRS